MGANVLKEHTCSTDRQHTHLLVECTSIRQFIYIIGAVIVSCVCTNFTLRDTSYQLVSLGGVTRCHRNKTE